ncbi:MAG: Ldh family oxidoreductase [Parvibaculaceae bacterium]
MSRLSFADAMGLVENCLERNGCSKDNSRDIAQVIVSAEADGCVSHGLFRVPGYVGSLRSGKVDGKATARLTRTGASTIRVDGQGGFAPPAHRFARSSIIEMARAEGIALASFVDIYHFSALWADIEPICAEDLCAMAFTSYLPSVAPAGGTKPLFGTNPMAFGWPRRAGEPMIFDQASSVLARGDIMIAARDGHRMTEGVGIDAAGHPTTDPNEILKGAMLPFGGYKGSAIAMMVELLAGPLIGEALSFEAAEGDNKDGGPPKGGELVIVLSPQKLGQADWREHGERLFGRILQQPGTRLPADRRYANRERSRREGLEIAGETLARIEALL